jgi:RNA recognition motif-containing protein
MIPYINRTVDIILSDRLEARTVNVKEVIDEFKSQCDNFEELFEAFVFMAPGRFRITCRSSRKLEILENQGFFVRGLPVEYKAVSSFTWVNITRLSYGISEEEVRKVLSPFGKIQFVKQEQYSNVYTGVRNVLMEVHSDIPARLRIAGHWCFVRYKGQKKICFNCNKPGHVSSECPARIPPEVEVLPVTEVAASIVPANTSSTVSSVTTTSTSSTVSVSSTCDPIVTSVVSMVVTDSPVAVGASTLADYVPPSQEAAVIVATVDDVPRSHGLKGSKRRRSPGKSKSPKSKKDRRGDPASQSPSGHSSGSDSEDFFSSDERQSEELSFSSDIINPVDSPSPEDVPLPDDDTTVTDTDQTDYPLTQATPVLPKQGRDSTEAPEADSQLSEETRVTRDFFANFTGTVSPVHGENAEKEQA